MSNGQTYYELLGVRSRAPPDAIRAAYIGLMKRHHPNSPFRLDEATVSEDVHTINIAYSVLRDPEKRAAYDATLKPSRGGVAAPNRLSAARRLPVVVNPQRRAASRRSAWLVPLLAIVLGAAWKLSQFDDWPNYQPTVDRTATSGGMATSLPEGAGPSDSRWIREQAHLAAISSVPDAVMLSTRCFKEADEVGLSDAADQCIVFDLAFVYWREGANAAGNIPPYFQQQNMQFRHSRAQAKFEPEVARLRLDSIRAKTFTALLEMVDPSPSLEGNTVTANSAIAGANQTEPISAVGGPPAEPSIP